MKFDISVNIEAEVGENDKWIANSIVRTITERMVSRITKE